MYLQLVSFEKIVEEAEGKHKKKEKDQREKKNKMEMTIKVFQLKGNDGCCIKAVPGSKEEERTCNVQNRNCIIMVKNGRTIHNGCKITQRFKI